jgi:hypothetical protein
VNAKTVMSVGVVAVLSYAAYRLVGALGKLNKTAGAALESAQGATADVLTRLFGPELSQAARESLFYTVTFDENNARHSVPSSTVSSEGVFRFRNPPFVERAYALYKDKQGAKHARPIL